MTLTLFFVMDALGTIPAYLGIIEKLPAKKRSWIVLRELFLSLGLLFLFFYIGGVLIRALGIYDQTVEVSGGILLFIIATRFIFLDTSAAGEFWEEGTHVIVPIATPIIANPSMFAALMIFSTSAIPNPTVLVALLIAWLISALIYVFALPIQRVFTNAGLMATQRLMGLVVALIAVQRILHGLSELFGG